MEITIFGKGNMGKAIGGNFEKAGQKVTYGGRDFKGALGDMVVLAVPYGAVDSILSAHKEELAGKVGHNQFPAKEVAVDHIDPVVPVSGFTTWDEVIERMFVEKEGLQVLCNECHRVKCQEEKQQRKQAKG